MNTDLNDSTTPDPDYDARLGEAHRALHAGRIDEALAKFGSLVRDRPHRAEGFEGRAWVLFRSERFVDAEADFAAALGCFAEHDASPRCESALHGIALCLFHQGRWEETLDAVKRLLARFPSAADAQLSIVRAKCLEAMGEVGAALESLGEAQTPDAQTALLREKTHLLLRLGRLEEASAANAEALAAAPRDVHVLLQSAATSIRCRDMQRARAAILLAADAAKSIPELDSAFSQVPAVLDGWERTSMWINLEQRVGALIAAAAPDSREQALALSMRLKLALRDHRGFIERLDESATLPGGALLSRLRRTGGFLRAERFPDFSRPKVFGIGLTKTGTTSLTRALDILGFHATHYVNDLTRELIRIEDACLFDALLDTPVCALFEALYHLFPNSKFVYTVRDTESWEKSFNRHFERHHGSRIFDDDRRPAIARDAAHGIGRMVIHGMLFHPHGDAIAAYRAYDERVRRFFGAHDPTRLLLFDVYAGDGWERLCPFLGRPIPSRDFPWENRAAR